MFSTVSKYVSTTYYYIVKAQTQSYYTAADSSRVLPGLIPFAKVKAQLYGLLERMWGKKARTVEVKQRRQFADHNGRFCMNLSKKC